MTISIWSKKDKVTKDGITLYDWTICGGYVVRDLGVQKVDNSKVLTNVELSKSILLVFLLDLSLFNTTLHKINESGEKALSKSLR